MADDSCLVNRLNNFLSLTDRERDFVAQMEKDEQPAKRGETLVSAGAEVNDLMVLKSGWALVRGAEVDGRRPVLRIYLPGEVIGLAEVGRGQAPHCIEMKTEGTVCPFPRVAIAQMFADAPRLAGLLFSLNSLEQIALRDLLRAVGHLSASDRLIHLLLALRDRSDLANIGNRRRFPLPLTQQEIGDCLGLTKVYVGKVFRELRQGDLLELTDRHVRIKNAKALETRVGYVSTYDEIDTSWYSYDAEDAFFSNEN